VIFLLNVELYYHISFFVASTHDPVAKLQRPGWSPGRWHWTTATSEPPLQNTRVDLNSVFFWEHFRKFWEHFRKFWEHFRNFENIFKLKTEMIFMILKIKSKIISENVLKIFLILRTCSRFWEHFFPLNMFSKLV
jgi:hypothetical protein